MNKIRTAAILLVAALFQITGCAAHSTTSPDTTVARSAGAAGSTDPAELRELTETERQVEILIMRLYAEDLAVQRSGAEGLANLGSDARSALPALRACASYEEGTQADACAGAVQAIDGVMIGMAGDSSNGD